MGNEEKKTEEAKVLGFTCSTFDLLHAGHVTFLEECKKRCDVLWVGLQTSVTDRPNKRQPVQTVYERWKQLEAVKYVDRILPYESEADLENLVASLPTHVRFLGSDYKHSWTSVTGNHMYGNVFNENRMEMVDRNHSWSSTELEERIKSR